MPSELSESFVSGRPNSGWFEKTIERVWPSWAASRERSRLEIKALRMYEAAQQGRVTQNWKTARQSDANAPIEHGLHILWARSRDLVRNSAYASRGVGVIVDRSLSTGLWPIFDGADQAKARVTEAFKDWATAPCDSEGIQTFQQLQRLGLRTIVESGEVIAKRQFADTTSKIPLVIDLFEPDYCDQSYSKILAGGPGERVIQGVKFNDSGKRVGYYLHAEHPGASNSAFSFPGFGTTLHDAEDTLMVFRRDRPGQVRGVPWLAPVILRLRLLDEYLEARLIREKVAACFAGFIRDIPGFGLEQKPYKASETPVNLEPGLLARLPPGTDMTIASPPSPNGDDRFVMTHLHAIAVGLGITYQSLTGDLSQGNFSQGRLGGIEMAITLAQTRQMFVEQFLDNVMRWWLQAARIAGLPVQNIRYRWADPGRHLIDPQAESEANRIAIMSGQKSPQQVIAELGINGGDYEAVIRDTAEFFASARAQGVLYDVDLMGKLDKEAEVAAAAPKPSPPVGRGAVVTNGHRI